MLQPRVSRDVIEGGSVHVWLDLTSEFFEYYSAFELTWPHTRVSFMPLFTCQFSSFILNFACIFVHEVGFKIPSSGMFLFVMFLVCFILNDMISTVWVGQTQIKKWNEIKQFFLHFRSTDCPYATEKTPRGLWGE